MPWRNSLKNYTLALQTVAIVAVLVVARAVLWRLGIEGIEPDTGVEHHRWRRLRHGHGHRRHAVGLPGRRARAHRPRRRALRHLREAESMHAVWGAPNLPFLRERLVAVVDALRRDIDAGNTRECQEAVEALNQSFLELEESDVPAKRIEAEETATTDESDDPTQEPTISDLEEVIDAAAEEAADVPPPNSSVPGASTPGS